LVGGKQLSWRRLLLSPAKALIGVDSE